MSLPDSRKRQHSVGEESVRQSVTLSMFSHTSDLPFASKEEVSEHYWDEEKAQHTAGTDGRTSLGPDAEIVVDWNGPNDPFKAMNWSRTKKWKVTIMVSCFAFISPFASTMVEPALPDMARQFGVPIGFKSQLMMSIFLIGYAQGPFVLAPLSETFGRVKVLQWANLVFLCFNIACGFATSYEQMLAFRFLSGLGGAAPQALGNSVLADTWSKEQRGRGQSIYGTLTFFGPGIAPIIGAYIAQGADWNWIFHVTSFMTVVVQVCALFFLKESYEPVILAKEAKTIRKQMRKTNPDVVVRTVFQTMDRSPSERRTDLRKRLALPFVMMFTHPATIAPAVFRAYLYGVMYLMFSTFDTCFVDVYGMSEEHASLNFLSMCSGFVIGIHTVNPLMDWLYVLLKKRNNMDEGTPEFRVPLMIFAGVLCPIGLCVYGWGAYYKLHFMILNIGSFILSLGIIVGFQTSQAYTTDAYKPRYAASANSAGAFLRTMFGFGFPLFAPMLFEKLGLGYGNTLLAVLTFVFALASPVMLWFYGAKMRAMSTRGIA